MNVDASGDAIVFADEMGSVPSLEREDSEDSDYESEEESDEEEDDYENVVLTEEEESSSLDSPTPVPG